jgi:hypothetical protein
MNMKNYWEDEPKYIEDISLVVAFWKTIEHLNFVVINKSLSKELDNKFNAYQVNIARQPKNTNWDIAHKYFFYEDIEFLLELVNCELSKTRYIRMQYPEYHNKEIRQAKLVDFFKSKYYWLNYV